MTEADLSRSVRDMLEDRGIRYARNCTSRRDSRGQYGLRVPKFVRAECGGPDLLICPNGLPVVVAKSMQEVTDALARYDTTFGIELKLRGEVPSPDQLRWFEWMKPGSKR